MQYPKLVNVLDIEHTLVGVQQNLRGPVLAKHLPAKALQACLQIQKHRSLAMSLQMTPAGVFVSRPWAM